MNKVFVIGGNSKYMNATKSCLQFDTRDYSWKEVVVGGYDNILGDLNSVESYDVTANTWTPMPNMIGQRMGHSLVAVKNKIFVIGGNINGTCELFESISKKCVVLKFHIPLHCNNAFAIGTQIYILLNNNSLVVTYDFDNDEWSKEASKATKIIDDFSCAKFPVY